MSLSDTSNLRGQHALFSPSQPTWINLNPEDFQQRLKNKFRSQIGTEIHSWVSIQIMLGHKLTSVKEIAKDVETFIFEKYYSEKYGLSKDGLVLLKCLKFMPADIFETVKIYVNDAVGYKMDSEEVVDYTDYFFGTADAIKFKDKLLRIHDLKTGDGPVHIEQLLIYAALFCLKNKIDPYKIDFELRVYQHADILYATPNGDDIKPIMDTIVDFDKIVSDFMGGSL